MWRTATTVTFVLAATIARAKDVPLYPVEDCNPFTNQMDLNDCANTNADAADAALNALYKKVMAAKTDQASKDGLRDSERSWIRYRDKTCADDVGPREDGGSIWPMDMADCLQKQTDARIRTLRRMLTCTAGASACNPH